MPYPFAHPAAILPLIGPMGRYAVPSALAIGAMAPDFWYLAPPLQRDHSHSAAGLIAFCLPAGLLAYLLFHLLLKQPLLALLPARVSSKLAALAFPALPQVSWAAVLASLLAGAATHLLWDAAAHSHRLLQHASTLLGAAVLAGWLARWLRRAPARELPKGFLLPAPARWSTLALFGVLALAALWHAPSMTLPHDVAELRTALRAGGPAAAQALGLSCIGYALIWKLLR